MSVSVVIPCYHSAQSIEALVDKLSVLKVVSQVVLVNDNSRDATWDAIERASAKHGFVEGYNLARNVGQHNALLVGIRQCRNDTVITMDDDLQHDPQDIPKMLAKLEAGADLVYGVPEQTQQNFLRRLSSDVSKRMFESLLNMPNAADSSAFRAISANGKQALLAFSGGLVDIDAILSWGVRDVALVKINHQARLYGQSNYSYRKLFAHALKMIIAYSEAPLIISFFVGVMVLLLSVGMITYYIAIALIEGTTVPGFTMLLCTILFFSGTQILMIGILSRYVGSIHSQVNGKPIAIVRSTAGVKKAKPLMSAPLEH